MDALARQLDSNFREGRKISGTDRNCCANEDEMLIKRLQYCPRTSWAKKVVERFGSANGPKADGSDQDVASRTRLAGTVDRDLVKCP